MLRYYYNSIDKVHIQVDEASATNMLITITDENEIPYEFSNEYIIYEKENIPSNNTEKSLCKSINKLDNVITKIEYDWSDSQGSLKQRRIHIEIFNYYRMFF